MSKVIEIDTNALNSDKSSMSEELAADTKGAEGIFRTRWRQGIAGLSGTGSKQRIKVYGRIIENAMSVCTYLTEYMNCIEQASRAYTECEQSVAGVVNRIRI